jgi:hypothetical protein
LITSKKYVLSKSIEDDTNSLKAENIVSFTQKYLRFTMAAKLTFQDEGKN